MTSQTTLPELVRDTKLEATIQGELTIHTRPFGRRRHERWKRKHILGHGGCGLVWLECKVKDGIQEEDAGETRAVKRIDTSGHRSEHYVRELEALAKFSQDKYSDFFVTLLGWYDSPGYLNIAMEYCEFGDLKKYLADNNNVLPENQVKEIISQILAGVALMHEAGFANRDIKPANILIKSKPPDSWWVKVCDMGLSKRIGDTMSSTTVRGTPGFMPPELHGFYGSPMAADPFLADMWCLGETAFQALTGRPVFNMLTDLGKYQSGTLSFPEDALRRAHAGPAAIDFVRSLMRSHPWERLGALRAVEHPWVRLAPDPAVYNHGWIPPQGPASTLGLPWQPGFPRAPGDQLTQASGQWTVTMPYSSPAYNLPPHAPPLGQGGGFQDPTPPSDLGSQSRGNQNPYGSADKAGQGVPMMPSPGFDSFGYPPVQLHLRSSVSNMEQHRPPVPNAHLRNRMSGPGIWGPASQGPILVGNGSSAAPFSEQRAANNADARASHSPLIPRATPLFAEEKDEGSAPTPVAQLAPGVPIQHSREPKLDVSLARDEAEPKTLKNQCKICGFACFSAIRYRRHLETAHPSGGTGLDSKGRADNGGHHSGGNGRGRPKPKGSKVQDITGFGEDVGPPCLDGPCFQPIRTTTFPLAGWY